MGGPFHQAGCVVINGRGVLIEGAPGIGKSSLALALIDRGAILVGDDGVCLKADEGTLWAHPPPHASGLIEIRNLGLIPMEITPAPVPVALVIGLDHQAPRFIDAPTTAMRAGCPLPLIHLWPDSPVLALRAEYALRHYGLHYGHHYEA